MKDEGWTNQARVRVVSDGLDLHGEFKYVDRLAVCWKATGPCHSERSEESRSGFVGTKNRGLDSSALRDRATTSAGWLATNLLALCAPPSMARNRLRAGRVPVRLLIEST